MEVSSIRQDGKRRCIWVFLMLLRRSRACTWNYCAAPPPLSSATSTPSSTWGACPALPLRQCQGVILAWDQDGHLEWNLRMLD